MKSSAETRQAFLDFFAAKGHRVVPSSPLVPGNDATLLFTNAGMVQFKDVFLGAERRSYTRAASSQRCVRAGGKHNDLDAVGYTARHHTFFEMLGNFSFGDYFKQEAIQFAWELLTEVYRLPKEKLWVTVYHTDDEAYALWHEKIGIAADRIVRIGDNKGVPFASDNFWQMADTGPCGPCTEIFYDHGPDVPGGPPGSPDADGDRYIEIWNLVFMQFDRAADGTLNPLPAPCVDTGMGLERLCAVLQGVHSNYEIDLFRNLIKAAARLTGTEKLEEKSLRVIADHIRACAFLIVDGVLPSNEGRGYVLRRIIRRALRHGWMLGTKQPFFHKMVEALVREMGAAYPELEAKRKSIEATLKAEEERFAETLDLGMRIFEDIAARTQRTIAGADVFRLYDTFGFPADLTADIARERGLDIDQEGFEQAMQAQRERARASSQFAESVVLPGELVSRLAPTEFLGYQASSIVDAIVLALLHDGKSVQTLQSGMAGIVILDKTPFYAEAGGQIGDCGKLAAPQGEFAVGDTQKLAGVFFGHFGNWTGKALNVGDRVAASVDGARRQAIVLNHSATHLLHAALRNILGDHVQQKGSLVSAERLRFDFSHFQAIAPQQLDQIESLVNREIRENHSARASEMAYKEALDFGAMALFGEKYGERVRVMQMGSFSTELCGGTHVARTGDIGFFKIAGESAVAAGVRRIEAVTGENAYRHIREQEKILQDASRLLAAAPNELLDKLKQTFDKQKLLEKELEALRSKNAHTALDDLLKTATTSNGIHVLAARMEGVDSKILRESVDKAKQKLGDAVILLASAKDGKASLIAGVAGKALQKVNAGELLTQVAKQIGGKGGGRADMAQGGGDDTPQLDLALQQVPDWVAERLAQ